MSDDLWCAAFAFFADPSMQSFYKRFIRDYMRYRDEIQCLGHELVTAVREDARASGVPSGDYYALHIRRGDFQFKVRSCMLNMIIYLISDRFYYLGC